MISYVWVLCACGILESFGYVIQSRPRPLPPLPPLLACNVVCTPPSNQILKSPTQPTHSSQSQLVDIDKPKITGDQAKGDMTDDDLGGSTTKEADVRNSSSSILRSAASMTSEALMGRGGIGHNPARDCDAVIRDVRRRTARERVRIVDLFKDFDRLQHGEIFLFVCLFFLILCVRVRVH